MNIFRLALELFALYLLYKLIFDFIIPVIKTTKEAKKQFGDINIRMEERMNQQQRQPPPFNTTTKSAASTEKNDDYIEYEEVK